MKKTAVWILTLTLALLMCACSSAKEDPNLGVYTGQSGAMGSLSVPVDAAFPGGFSLELKSDGRAALTVNGDEYNVKWSAEGDRLKVEAADTVMSGTIGSGTIVLENVLDLLGLFPIRQMNGPTGKQKLPRAVFCFERPKNLSARMAFCGTV